MSIVLLKACYVGNSLSMFLGMLTMFVGILVGMLMGNSILVKYVNKEIVTLPLPTPLSTYLIIT